MSEFSSRTPAAGNWRIDLVDPAPRNGNGDGTPVMPFLLAAALAAGTGVVVAQRRRGR